MSLPDLPGFEEEELALSPLDDDEDEVYLIRVPKAFDITKLDGIDDYSPPGIVEIEAKEGKRGVVSVVELGSYGEKNLDVNLLVKSDDNTAIAGPSLTQSLCVSKSVHLNHKAASKTLPGQDAPDLVPMPMGLKPRFTPFGAGRPILRKHSKKKSKRRRSEETDMPNKKRIKIESTIVESLQERDVMDTSDYLSQNSSKSHKKHKKKKRETMESDEMVPNGMQMSLDESGINDSMASHHHRNRKNASLIKLEIDDDDAYRCDNETIFNNLLNGEALDNTHSANSSVTKSHKKKKKRKSDTDDHVSNYINTSIGNVLDSHKKKEKSELSFGYSSVDNSVNLDESLPSEKKSKKKKKKRDKDE